MLNMPAKSACVDDDVSVLHMLFTLVIQLVIMRRFEKMLGWLRIIIIYTVCGMAANVFSGIFLPYFVTVI